MANLYINVALNSLQYYSNYFIEIECLVEKQNKNNSDDFLSNFRHKIKAKLFCVFN